MGRAAFEGGDPTTNPNVLIVIDTSGSMINDVQTQVSYDPLQTYAGCFDTSQIYFSSSSAPTNCSSSQKFDASLLRCAAANRLDQAGIYQDRFTIYDTLLRNRSFNRWEQLGSKSYAPKFVDCFEDFGRHGETDADPAVYPMGGYPISGTSVWTGDMALAIGLDSFSEVTTLYTANYLNYTTSADVTFQSRLETVQQTLLTVLDGMSGVNVGLMRFDTNSEGGPVTYHVQDIAAHRSNLKAEMQSYRPGGGTPLSETMYEATQYLSGGAIDFGKFSNPGLAGEATLPGGTQYRTPILSQCQSNNIILLTDGEPTVDTSANDKIPNLPGFQDTTGKTECAHDHPSFFDPSDTSGSCLDELAGHLNNGDLSPDFDGAQGARTFTVGFQLDHPLLNATAAAGGGRHYRADDAVELTTAFTNIFTDVRTHSSTYTAPAVSVNAFNRTTHRNELFFTMFKPAATPHWDGNVKKYKIAQINGEPLIVDQNGRPAVDPDTGYFADSALSFWTQPANLPDNSASDGGDVDKGGAASELTASRRIYTYTGAAAPVNVVLNSASNLLHEDNAALSNTVLGIDGIDPTRETLLQWARGIDVDGEYGRADGGRPVMGDPLHSRPTVVQYGGTEANPDLTLFVTTNDGYLHAFDQATGRELFAFVPQLMLGKLVDLYTDTSSGMRPYGLDGSITVWDHDVDQDGVIEPGDGDHVYLYVGMRRGGSNYYALDVTDRLSPRLLWRIESGSTGFEELGQTWSDPVVAKMNVGGSATDVLVFGGGYDTAQDSTSVRLSDSIGRAVYVVNAETGQLIWRAGGGGSGANLEIAEMTNSIPSAMAVIDMNGDKLSDLMYVGDTAGQLFRFDIDNQATTGLAVTGGRIADLSVAGSVTDARRFYYPPDVSYQLGSGIPSYLALTIGSGYRAHPLDQNIQDRIYMLRDDHVFTTPDTYTTVTEADLFDATDNVLGEGDDASVRTAQVALNDSRGWFVRLQELDGSYIGEKVLSETQIVANVVTVSTFAPVAGLDPCRPNEGRGAVYFLNIDDATPNAEFDMIEGNTRADRRMYLMRGGIPPSPTLVITEDETVNLVGPEIVMDPSQRKTYKTYWHER